MRRFGPEHAKAGEQEVEKLLKAGFIQEKKSSMWLSEPVCVKKLNGEWRVCIDFTYLNPRTSIQSGRAFAKVFLTLRFLTKGRGL